MNDTRFPFVAIVRADEAGKPTGPARVRRLLKELGRRYGVKIEWQEKSAASDQPTATEPTAKTASQAGGGTCRNATAVVTTAGGKTA